MLTSTADLPGWLDERKVGIVGHNGFGKDRELDALLAQLVDLAYNFFNCAFPAIKNRADLHSCRFNCCRCILVFHCFYFIQSIKLPARITGIQEGSSAGGLTHS